MDGGGQCSWPAPIFLIGDSSGGRVRRREGHGGINGGCSRFGVGYRVVEVTGRGHHTSIAWWQGLLHWLVTGGHSNRPPGKDEF